MKRTLLAGLAGLSCLALMTAAAHAQGQVESKMVIAPQPVPLRVATADVVIVGKVTNIEDKTVSAPQFPGVKNKVEYQIAVVKIDDPILGAKGLTHIRVGFVPPQAIGGPGPRPIGRPGIRAVTLAKDQEVCLFLTPHFEADFHTAPAYFDVIDKKSPNFDKEVAEAKKAAKLMADPDAGLKSKDAGDRYLTAAMLLTRYRTPKPGAGPMPKQEPIDATQSKLILEALADADWTNNSRLGMMNPQGMFYRLGLKPEDGWTPPKDFREFPDLAKKWLKDNAGTYRIQQFVAPEKADEKKDSEKKDK